MRPRHLYRIQDEQQSKDWWFSKQHEDVVCHKNVMFSVYNDDFLSGISTCSSMQIVSVLPLSDWTESVVAEFFLLDLFTDIAILTDVDKLGFGKDFWINFIDLAIENDYQFSIVTRNKASKFCSNIDKIKDSKTLWNQSEIVYNERVLLAKPECARILFL